MTKNIGNSDMALRLMVGAALIVLTLMGSIGVWGWIGVVLLATAVIRWCPAYSILGASTRGAGK
jgi:O-antigen ligase